MAYKPKQGDIIYLDFDPQAGHEQRGRRPALVVSNGTFNRFSKMIMVCPITNTDKNHPFHIRLEEGLKTTGVVLCDQVKCLDIEVRNSIFIESVPDNIISEAIDLIVGFVEIE